MNQVFDICPTYGFIQPGEIQKTAITFRALPGVEAKCNFLCKVHGGPKYILPICGRADSVRYELESNSINFGNVQYDHLHSRKIMLKNTGKVEFKFTSDENSKILPGEPCITPSSGVLQAGEAVELEILYLPGIPEKFKKELTLQIGSEFPEFIQISGVASFSRVLLWVLNGDLPRDLNDTEWYGLVERLREVSIDKIFFGSENFFVYF